MSLVVRAYLHRGAIIWAGARAIASAVLRLASVDPLHFSPAMIAAMIALSVLVALAQTTRLGEHVLLGNLGVGPRTLVLIFAIPAMLGEAVLLAAGLVV